MKRNDTYHFFGNTLMAIVGVYCGLAVVNSLDIGSTPTSSTLRRNEMMQLTRSADTEENLVSIQFTLKELEDIDDFFARGGGEYFRGSVETEAKFADAIELLRREDTASKMLHKEEF